MVSKRWLEVGGERELADVLPLIRQRPGVSGCGAAQCWLGDKDNNVNDVDDGGGIIKTPNAV